MESIITLDIAATAFGLLKTIWQGGEYQPLLDMLTDDTVYSMPAGNFRGEVKGKEKLAEMYKAIRPYYVGSPLKVENILNITSNESTVVYEFTNSGIFPGDVAYDNKLAFSFTIKDGKVSAYREYVGDISPVFLKVFLGLG